MVEGRLADRQTARLQEHIERVLKLVPCSLEGQRGCFSINSHEPVRSAPTRVARNRFEELAFLKYLIVKNVEAEKPEMKPTVLAEMILTFLTGISMEQHLRVGKASMNRKVDGLMNVVRKL